MQKITKNGMLILLIFALVGQSCKKDNNKNVPEPPQPKKYVVTTLAGAGTNGFANGAAATAQFNDPSDVVIRLDGAVLVADGGNHRIRRIANGQVTTYAGSGNADTASGVGENAAFRFPVRLAADNTGSIFTLDANDPRIRGIRTDALVNTLAGPGERGFANGNVGVAKFGQAFGITVDAQGNIYIADSENHRIRRISPDGQVTKVAGTGEEGIVDGDATTQAKFFFPEGIVIDGQGNLYVADVNRIRKITPAGFVTTLTGTATPGFKDGGPGEAQFLLIEDMVIDAQGNLYVTDNNSVRKISPQGNVTTIAGTGQPGFNDGDGPAAKFNEPQGLGIDAQGNIYVADFNNHRVRKISFQ
jgi:sugar lactone lactonase YvrE